MMCHNKASVTTLHLQVTIDMHGPDIDSAVCSSVPCISCFYIKEEKAVTNNVS